MSAGLLAVSVVAVGLIVILVIRMVVDPGSHGCCCLLFDSCIRSAFLKIQTLKIQPLLLFFRCKIKLGAISRQFPSSEKISIYFRDSPLKGLRLFLFYAMSRKRCHMWTKSLVVIYSFLHVGRSVRAGIFLLQARHPQVKYSDILNVSDCCPTCFSFIFSLCLLYMYGLNLVYSGFIKKMKITCMTKLKNSVAKMFVRNTGI